MRWYYHSKGRASTRRLHFSWVLYNETRSQKIWEKSIPNTARAKALRRRKMSYTRRSEWRSRRPSAVISRRKSSRGQQGLGAAQSLWLWKEINICSKILFWDMNWGSSHSPTSLTFRCPITLSNCFQRMGPARGERADTRSIDTTRLALFLKLVAEITGVKDNVL